jgi:hypothetical protein
MTLARRQASALAGDDIVFEFLFFDPTAGTVAGYS